jgi:hypothetical protein
MEKDQMPYRFVLVLFSILALATGCSSSNGDTVSGKGSVRGLHAIPELGTASFLIEETVLSSLDYKDASGISEYDDLNYDFNFDILLPGDSETTRLATRNLSVDAETAYTFVLTGTLENPSIILWEYFGRDWAQELEDADEADTEVTVLEVAFGHIDAGLGALDVFLEAPGSSPASALPRGTIEHGALLPPIEIVEGDYQLVLTPAGEPETILFASEAIELPAATTNLFTVMDGGGMTTADFSVRWIGASLGAELTDLFVQPELDVLHAAFGTEPVDVIVGDAFDAPFAAGLAWSGLSEGAVLDRETEFLVVTPAGNPGVFLAQKEIDFQPDTYNRLLLAGLPGSLQTVLLSHDKRRLATHARVQIFHAAARFQTMDIYLAADDVDITLTGPNVPSALFGSGTGYVAREAGAYNVVLTAPGTKSIIGGPFPVELEQGRNYGIVVVDAPDITAADIFVFDQTPE